MYEFRVDKMVSAVDGRRRVVWEAVNAQPSWVTRAALMVFFLVIVLPIAVLLFIALVAAVVIFGVLAMAARAWAAITGGRRVIARPDVRKNVRVIDRGQ